jgi:transcriptional regulator with XRE-family HTH domain
MAKKIRSQFGTNLREVRKTYGIDAQRLSDGLKLGDYGRQTISNWENGKREPDLYTLCKIADFLGVSTDRLLGRTNKSEKEEKKPLMISKFNNLIVNNLDELNERDLERIYAIAEAYLKVK